MIESGVKEGKLSYMYADPNLYSYQESLVEKLQDEHNGFKATYDFDYDRVPSHRIVIAW
jgi:hypothetical protein